MTAAALNYPLFECEVVTDFARLEAIAAEWNKLWIASLDMEIFQSFNWARAFWKTFGEQLSLFTPVVYRGTEVIGILPLVLRDGTLRFIGSPLCDYNDVICADESTVEVMVAAVDRLLAAQEHWKSCVLDNVAAESRLARHLADLPLSARRHFQATFRCPCSTIVLDTAGEIATEISGRTSLRRHEKDLRKLGQLEFAHVEDREVIAANLDTFFNQHIARRAVAGDSSHFLEEPTRRMFKSLVQELDPRSQLRFAMLTLDDRPIAYHFGFEVKGKFVLYQMAFDINHSRSSPGEVLLRHLFLYAKERKLSEFDMTRGGEAYKDRFATHIRQNLTLYFSHDSGPRQRIMRGVRSVNGGLRRSLESLRKYPPAYRLARGAALYWIRLWRRERQLRQYEGTAYTANVLRRSLHNCIFAKETIATFSMGKQEVGSHVPSVGDGLAVAPALLSELAIVSVLNRDLSPSLPEFRARFLAGQQAYVVRQGPEPVQIWWAIENSNPRGVEAGAENLVLMLEHSWTVPWFRRQGLSKAIVQQICSGARDVLISCHDCAQEAQALRNAGIRIERRTTKVRLLHWLRPVFVTHP